jgi:hypothetical protein
MRFFVTPLSAALCTLGVLCAIVGFVYLTRTAPQLPSFLPGHIAHSHHPRIYYKRAIPLLLVSGAALYAANRVSKAAVGDW